MRIGPLGSECVVNGSNKKHFDDGELRGGVDEMDSDEIEVRGIR